MPELDREKAFEQTDYAIQETTEASRHRGRPRLRAEISVETPRRLRAVPPQNLQLEIFSTQDLEALTPTTTSRSLARYAARRPEYVYMSAHLEGNSYTLPEVRTLLEGKTVSGKKLVSETIEVLNLSAAAQHFETMLN